MLNKKAIREHSATHQLEFSAYFCKPVQFTRLSEVTARWLMQQIFGNKCLSFIFADFIKYEMPGIIFWQALSLISFHRASEVTNAQVQAFAICGVKAV